MNRDETIKILRAYGTLGWEIRTIKEMGTSDGQERVSLLERVQQDVSSGLNQLEYVEMDAIWGRYVKSQSMEVVRRRHCYSERQMRNIVNRALKKLGETLETSEAVRCYFREKRRDDTT
ncbi:MAG: hypothetical protein LUE89_11245 [Clostridiales bacterium]|nr:hypothetical protein [Clostridiales bacterium]